MLSSLLRLVCKTTPHPINNCTTVQCIHCRKILLQLTLINADILGLSSMLYIFFGGGGGCISRDEGSRVGMDVGGPEQGGGGDGEEAHTDTTVPGLHLPK